MFTNLISYSREMKKLFTSFALSFLAILPTVLAETAIPGGSIISSILGIPDSWLVFPAFIYQFIIPFAALWVVAYGLIKQLRIFDRPRNFAGVIGFLIAFSTLGPSGYLGIFGPSAFYSFVSGTLGLAGAFAYLIFISLFFVGGGLYWWGSVSRSRTSAGVYSTFQKEQSDIDARLRELNDRYNGLLAQVGSEHDPNRRTAIERELEKTRQAIQDMQARLEQLRRFRQI